MSMTGVNAWMTAVRNNFELIAYWRKLSTSTSHHLCTNFAIDTRGRGRRYRSLCTSPEQPVPCAPHTSGYQMHHHNPDMNVSLLINWPNTPHHYIIIFQQACRLQIQKSPLKISDSLKLFWIFHLSISISNHPPMSPYHTSMHTVNCYIILTTSKIYFDISFHFHISALDCISHYKVLHMRIY